MEKEKPKVVGYIARSEYWCENCIRRVDEKFPRWRVLNTQFYDSIPLCSGCDKPLDVKPSLNGLMWLGDILSDDRYAKVDRKSKKVAVVVDPMRLRMFLDFYGDVGRKWVKTAMKMGYISLEGASALSLAKNIILGFVRDLFKGLRGS